MCLSVGKRLNVKCADALVYFGKLAVWLEERYCSCPVAFYFAH